MNIPKIIAGASNMRGGTNPPFYSADFKRLYPQFFKPDGEAHVPDEVLDMYIDFAHASVKEGRFHETWKVAISLFVAHYVTLYLQTMTESTDDPRQAINSAQNKGLVTSKSVDGVSKSYDYSTAISDLEGWSDWKLTAYGVQYASLAKECGKGGMMVW